MREETGRECGCTSAWFGSVGGDRRAGTEDNTCDVGAKDCWVGGNGEAIVTLMPFDWFEGDGFDLDEELIRIWGWAWPVLDGGWGAL